MSYTVTLWHKPTGRIKDVKFEQNWEEGSDFLWDEGNYACDCNRAIFFEDDSVEDEGRDCSGEDYIVTKIVVDGNIVYGPEE